MPSDTGNCRLPKPREIAVHPGARFGEAQDRWKNRAMGAEVGLHQRIGPAGAVLVADPVRAWPSPRVVADLMKPRAYRWRAHRMSAGTDP